MRGRASFATPSRRHPRRAVHVPRRTRADEAEVARAARPRRRVPPDGAPPVCQVRAGPANRRRSPMTALSADERQELAQSVRSACERLAPEDRVRAVAYGEGDHSGFDTVLWDVLCNQVGVAAIALPELLGGAGYGASALGVVAHELGRALAPVPFVSSAVLATGLLLDLTEHDPDADKRLSGLIEGRRTAAAALTGDGGLWRRSAVTLRAARTGGGWSIDGTVRHVLGGFAADDLVVAAVAGDGEPALFLLDPTVDGVVAEAERVLDGTRPMATITLSSAPALRLSGDGPLSDVVDRNGHIALAVVSAGQGDPVE